MPRKARGTTRKAKEEKPVKVVYVIMPFQRTPTRGGEQLTGFFENNIKQPIERARLKNRYEVRRSDETFNITAQIIKDLHAADIVICDLSGENGNPNVMYELGMRLAFSNEPVILIREKHKDNKAIFDITGFYAESYDPFKYTEITAHLIDKIRRFETGNEEYGSPVLSVLGEDLPLLARMSQRRAASLLENLRESVAGTLALFGGAATQFIEGRTAIKLGRKAVGFHKELFSHRDEVNSLDWSDFAFRPGTQPAIDSYIASRYLEGIIDPEMERAFTESVIDYHSFFLAGDYMISAWVPGMIHKFAGETELIVSLANFLIGTLTLTDKAALSRAARGFFSDYRERTI